MYDIIRHAGKRRKRNLAEYHVKRLVLSPPHWKTCKLTVPLSWRAVKFTYSSAKTIPKKSGVYTFVVQPGIANHPYCSYLVYVGQTAGQTFRERYRQYLTEGRAGDLSARPHVTDMLEKWDGYLWFCFAVIDAPKKIEDVENTLLAAYLPPTNKDFPATVSKSLRKLFGT